MRLLIILLSFFSLSLAQAQLKSPEALLNQASTNVNALHEVILELQHNLTQITMKDQFRGYFNILPSLKIQSTMLGLDNIHPGAIDNLGEQMVAYGVRWLDIAKEDTNTINKHLEWMSAATAHRYVYNAEELIQRSLPEDARRISQNLDAFVAHTTKEYTQDLYIAQAYRNLLSELAVKQIQNVPIEDQTETVYWIQKINNQETLSSYIFFLLETTYKVTPLTRGNLDHLLLYTLAIKNLLDKNLFPVSVRTYTSLGEVILEIIDKSMLFLWPLRINQAAEAIPLLSVSQAGGLADRLILASHQSIPDMDEHLTFYAETLMYQLSILGAPEKADQFAGIFYSTVPSAIRTFQKYEATYKVEEKKTRTKWIVSFSRYTSSGFILNLYNEKSKKLYTLPNVSYDVESGVFLATSSTVTNASSGFYAKVQFLLNDQILVEIPDTKGGWLALEGQVEQKYTPPPIVAITTDPQVEGEFSGEYRKQNGRVRLNVTVTKVNERYVAHLVMQNGDTSTLEGFFSWADGRLYLTSNIPTTGEVVHLRLSEEGDQGLKGTIHFATSSEIFPVDLQLTN